MNPTPPPGRDRGALRACARLRTRLCGALTVLVLGLVAAAVAPPSALSGPASATALPAADGGAAAGSLPPGWSLTSTAAGVRLTYRADVPLPRTDAGIQVYVGARQLGQARLDGRVATIDLPTLPEGLAGLQLRSGGRPLGRMLAQLTREANSSAALRGPAPDTAVVPPSLTPAPAEPITAVDYELPPLKEPAMRAPLRVLARIIAPRTPRADRPLVLFAHGRHGTCYRGSEVSGDFPCPKGWRSLPSLLGYQHAQRLLAGQGFVTVSIDLNGVNGQDDTSEDGGAGARAALIRHHLNALAEWADHPERAPFATRLAIRFDPRRVLLIGHSRGGEGVTRAAAEATAGDPFAVAGLLLIAPTNFARTTIPNLPTTVLLPGCDGDVSDLQGQLYADRALDTGIPSALHSAVFIAGSNHNFFNSEWTPRTAVAPAFDDGEWSPCRSRDRLSDQAVRSVGATYALATAFSYLAGEQRGLALLDGSTGTPPGLGVRDLLVTPVGGPRQLLWRGNAPGTPAGDVVGGRLCRSLTAEQTTCGSAEDLAGPHWLAADDRVAQAARLTLATAGAAAGIRFPEARDVADADWLEARVVVRPRTAGRLLIRIEDTSGRVSTLTPIVGAALRGLPRVLPSVDQPGWSGRWWAQLVRVPLAAARTSGVDLHALRAVTLLTPGGGLDGSVLMDLHAARPGLGGTDRSPLPRLSAATRSVTIAEGSAPRDVPVTFTLDRPAPADVQVVASVAGEGGNNSAVPTPRRYTLAAGSTRLAIPVSVTGDRLDSADQVYLVTVEANGPAVTGTWISRLTVTDDDPPPVLSISPTATAREGAALTWVASLDRVSGQDVSLTVTALPTRRELTIGDLPPAARATWQLQGPPTRRLSAAGLTAYLSIPAGQRSVRIVLPTRRDGVREGAEQVVLQVMPERAAPARPIRLLGTVRD